MTVTSPAGAALGGGRPGPGRLPAVRRERRPALAALAVLLILGGGLVSGLLAYRSGQRADYLVLVRDVAIGQQLTGADLGTARIAGTGTSPIPAGDRDQVVGRYMTVGGRRGTLLISSMVSTTQPIPDGSAVVGVAVADGQAPAGGVDAGEVVQVLRVPAQGGSGGPQVLVAAARVLAVSASSSGSGVLGTGSTVGSATVVNVLVPADASGSVATASVQHQVALVLLPPATKPLVGGS